MECKEFLDLLSGRADRENTKEEDLLLQRHLSSCARCRARLADYEVIDRAVADLSEDPPEGLAENVMARISPPAKKRRFIFGGGTLAAVIVLAILLPSLSGPKNDAPAEKKQTAVFSRADETVRQSVRDADAGFAPFDEPLLIEITDDPDLPAAQNVAPLVQLPYVLSDGNPEYYVDAAAAREITGACGGYTVAIPDGLSGAADDAPCIVRIVGSK